LALLFFEEHGADVGGHLGCVVGGRGEVGDGVGRGDGRLLGGHVGLGGGWRFGGGGRRRGRRGCGRVEDETGRRCLGGGRLGLHQEEVELAGAGVSGSSRHGKVFLSRRRG
jgi:hypothetical protein